MQASQQSPIEWTGFYQEGNDKIPFQIQNMKIDKAGFFHGQGNNHSGAYGIDGKLLRDGSFNFNLNSYSGAPRKTFSGKITSAGALQGMFLIPGYNATPFELKVKTEDWLGSYTCNGQKLELRLSLMTSKTIYGAGTDA